MIHNRRGFVIAILLPILVAAMTATLLMMAVLVIKLNAYRAASMCHVGAEEALKAAIATVRYDPRFASYVNDSSCTAGSYINFLTGTCAAPNTAAGTNTAPTLGSACFFSAQLLSSTTGSVTISPAGWCSSGECAGAGSSYLKLNSVSITGKTCTANCTDLSTGGAKAHGSSDGCGGSCP